MIKVLFICHGNICRSPWRSLFCATCSKSAACMVLKLPPPPPAARKSAIPCTQGARRKLAEHGIRCSGKTARRLTRADYDDYDLIAGMDAYNLRNMQTLFGGDPDHKLHKLLSFCGEGADVADPWYNRRF